MAQTAIEWATHVENSFTGCDRVSPGCAHCYALSYAARLKGMGQTKYQNDGDPKTSGPGFGFTVHWDLLRNPPRRPAGARVFVNSMSDVFHEEAPLDAIALMWAGFVARPRADFLILTKRPERMRDVLSSDSFWADVERHVGAGLHARAQRFLPNVWLGTSIENRRFVNRADLLRDTPAAVRFISAEPLLGPLRRDAVAVAGNGDYLDVWADGHVGPQLNLHDIDWLIVGGESGKGHRRFDWDWARDLRDACAANGTAYFLKQGGGHRPGDKLEHLPEDLRIRQFPRAEARCI